MTEGFKKSRFAIRAFLLFFTSVFVVLFIIFITAENYDIKSSLNELKNSELNFLEKNSMYFCSYYSRAVSDVTYLKQEIEKSNELSPEKTQIMLESNHIYQSVRYIDAKGNEIFKSAYSNSEYTPADKNDMANISDSSYFIEASQIKEDEIYVSDIYFYKNDEMQDVPGIAILAKADYEDYNGMVAIDINVESMMEGFGTQVSQKEGNIYFVGKSGFWGNESKTFTKLNARYYKIVYGAGILPSERWELMRDVNYNINDDGMYVFYEMDHSWDIFAYNENIVFEEAVYKLISFIPQGLEYDYYLYGSFSEKIANVFQKNYPYFILGFLFSSAVVAYLILNKSKFEVMRNSSHFDPLTKAYNRSQGIKLLEESVSKIDYYKTICLCYADINGLKQVNDTLGHNVGDELIRTVTNTVHNMIREDDVMIRMGGDEFIIVFNKVGKAIAETIWSRIVTSLKAINSMEDRNYLISVSHGIVEIQNDGKKVNIDSLVTEADEKMYQEKLRIKKTFNSIRRK